MTGPTITISDSTGRPIEVTNFTDDDGSPVVALRPIGDNRDDVVIELRAGDLRAVL